MSRLILVPIVLIAATASAGAQDRRFVESLKQLDPQTRFDQVCDLAAMRAIRGENKAYRPDRAVGSAVSDVAVRGDTMSGTGGAFRSKGKWYQFSFTCTSTPDRMKVVTFKHTVGAEIPEEKWASYNLWK